MKVVINKCYGGFGLSDEALELGRKLSKNQEWGERQYDMKRHNKMLVRVVEQLGEKSWGECAKLKVVEIPDGTKYEIDEYDGMECIAETHRAWG